MTISDHTMKVYQAQIPITCNLYTALIYVNLIYQQVDSSVSILTKLIYVDMLTFVLSNAAFPSLGFWLCVS